MVRAEVCYALSTLVTCGAGCEWARAAVARRNELDEWVPVLLPPYAAARKRHAIARQEAYYMARMDAVEGGMCGPGLWMADIDSATLAVWKATWRGRHPSGAGAWKWPVMLEQLPHRAAVLPIAIWYEHDLCGLALGHASRHRANGSRHTVTLTYVERRPEPPSVPLRGHVVSLAVGAALNYGRIMGARRLRLRNPDRNLLRNYELLGFKIVRHEGRPVYCEREV